MGTVASIRLRHVRHPSDQDMDGLVRNAVARQPREVFAKLIHDVAQHAPVLREFLDGGLQPVGRRRDSSVD